MKERSIGILREVKNKWERRCPLSLTDVSSLVQRGVNVKIQPSAKRVFTDKEYQKAGAEVTDDLSSCRVILGVKEFPSESLLPRHSYLLFSHTIKAQPYNMGFLDQCVERQVRLFDYECIRDRHTQQRVVAFGAYAGIAGMIDGMRGLGERLLSLGFSTPFLGISSAYMYPDLEAARSAVKRCGEEISRTGLPREILPFTVVLTGSGNVANGALSILHLLPHRFVPPSELSRLQPDPHCVFAAQIGPSDMAQHKTTKSEAKAFDKQHYYQHPEEYEPVFHHRIAPFCSMLVNGMFWSPMFPRLITIEQHRVLQQNTNPLRSMLAVADITCDINGSVQMLAKSTTIEQPFFVYNSLTQTISDKIEGEGVLMLGVDNLPAEFPRDATLHFSHALAPLIESLASIDNTKPFSVCESSLLPELANAAITADGALTPNYQYIARLRQTQETKNSTATGGRATNNKLSAKQMHADTGRSGSLVRTYLLSGHLFDSGFVNMCLDLFEQHAEDFQVLYWNISPNRAARVSNASQCVIEVHFTDDAAICKTQEALNLLTKAVTKAQATITILADNQRKGPVLLHDEHSEQEKPVLLETVTSVTSPMQTSDPSSNNSEHKLQASLSQPVDRNITFAARDKVLVLGSGFVAAPLIDWLGNHESFHVIAASNEVDEVQKMITHLPHAECKSLDATNKTELDKLVQSASLVVSLLPVSMHLAVAHSCLAHKVHLVTASYTSKEMAALDSAAKERNLIFMQECGLDPGLDHMSAMKIIDEAKQRGAQVTHFTSVCGGLPAPECADNPFAYKFSWSPAGMLSAALRPAKYKKDSQVIEVDGIDILAHATPYRTNRALSLEYYPNHDSLIYESKYGLQNLRTLYRGTLRYTGTSELLRNCALLGMLERRELNIEVQNFKDLMALLFDDNDVETAVVLKLQEKGVNNESANRTLDALQWLGAFSERSKISTSCSNPFEAFCALLQSKLTFQPHERDLVILDHAFQFNEANGQSSALRSTLIAYGGEANKTTAMARTVGLPAAMCASLILKQACQSIRGVVIPTDPLIYKPILQQLQQQGIVFKEQPGTLE